MIALGLLPRPDHVAMVQIEWEVETVWPYVDGYIRPALEALGIPFTKVRRTDYSTHGFWGGVDDSTLLLPAFTNQSGDRGKLKEFCSGHWKRDVMTRWAATQSDWKRRGVDNWVGISWEERHRRGVARRQWFVPTYPLLDVRPTTVSGCLSAVSLVGWPPPPRSRCRHCPNQSDSEWLELTPDEWRAACQLDEAIRRIDPHAYLHKQLIPLREVRLEAPTTGDLFTGGCSSGTCY
jgi:hypothetical protein